MRSIANLLKPYNLEDFLDNNWTNKAVVIPSEGKKDFAHLFSWEKLNYLLNFHELKYPDIRLAVAGKDLSANAIDLPSRARQNRSLEADRYPIPSLNYRKDHDSNLLCF